MKTLVGRYMKFRYNHLFETVTFRAKIVKEGKTDGGLEYVTVRVPDRLRGVAFPPGGKQADGKGPKYLRYQRNDAIAALIQA